MAINVAYCFDQNNDLAHRSAFANLSLFKLLPLTVARRTIGGGVTMLGCEHVRRRITLPRMMSSAPSRAGFSERPDGMTL